MSEAAHTDTSPREPVGRIARSWSWTLAFGLLTLIAGILALLWPGPTILVIALIFGVQLLVGGIYWFVTGAGTRNAGTQLVLAVLAIVGGVLMLRNPVETALIFPLLLGLFWTVNGIVETFHTLTRHAVPARGWALAGGILSLIAGLALLIFPGLGLATLALVLGVWLVVYGAITTVRAIRMRQQAFPSSPASPDAGTAHP